ncbi:MAG: hypothetical protein H6Q50_309, partial [Deltaproteobacteria bacterium]|nr:hypothetical protein [Deltaproteobacteria bacterium]
MIRQRDKHPKHSPIVLVGKDSEDKDEFPEGEILLQGLPEDRCPGRIVGTVKDHHGPLPEHLQPPLPAALGKSLPDAPVIDVKAASSEELDGTEGAGGIDCLVPPPEMKVEIREIALDPEIGKISPATGADPDVTADTEDPGPLSSADGLEGFDDDLLPGCGHNQTSRLDDPPFFPGN